MSETDLDSSVRLARMQQRIYRCIEDELRQDGHHKSYEGAMEATLSLPNMFQQEIGPEWTVTLHCYVMALEGRHAHWTARTLPEALAKAESAIDKLCAPYEMARFARDMNACDDEPEEADGTATIYAASRTLPPEEG